MSRAELSQTGQTAPQRCPINMTWDLPQNIKKSFPDENQQKGFNLFRVNKPPPDPPRSQASIPIPIRPRPAPGSRAHLDNGYDAREPTHSPTEAQLSPRAIGGSPPTLTDPTSVAAPKPAGRAFAGKRTGGAPSKRNRHTKKGPRGSGTKPPSGPPPHRTQRTHRRDDRGPVDLDSRLRLRLAPQEGMFSQRSIRAKQRNLHDLSKWLKAIEEASARQGTTPAPAHVPGVNAVDDVSAPQRGFTKGSVQSGVSYAPWTGMQHFSTAAVYPTFSDRQRYGGFIPTEAFGAQYGQHHSGMASPNQPAAGSQHQYPADMRNADAWSVPASGPRHNARAHAHVEMEPTSVLSAPLCEAHAHSGADDRVVATTSLSMSHVNPASPVHAGYAGFDEQANVVWADAAVESPVPGAVSVSSLVDIPGDDAWTAAIFATADNAFPDDTPVVSIGLASQLGSEGIYRATPPSHTSTPPVAFEQQWRDSLHAASPLASLMDSELCNAPYQGLQVPMSTYSSLDGAVSGSS